MAEPRVVTALSKKRAELSGEIESTQRELQDMIRDLEHLDRALLIFDPAYENQAQGISAATRLVKARGR